ncbi:tRNA-dihydrouridine synthase [Niveomyces insectorum RCEF 264]|uniref:tRNA-dihydrouridine synthase n=1 Tax=Niveomyces insectorum RCEF 264 TaxID=1081102 RepID=A0A167VH47_9HYPO|nr:tRNA-dihydrouridine synthase [Niveomyces insectorum RCEF 264]
MTAEAVAKVPIPPRGVDYRGKVVLAPMVRSGELPSRLLALQYGADLVWGPETIDKSMIGTTRRVNERTGCIEWSRMPSNSGVYGPTTKASIIYRVHPQLEGRRLVYQMGTCDPDRAVQAARLVAADVAGIDVNAGCPKPFSTDGGMGAALLKTPDRLCAILEALVAHIVPAFGIGISVKIRLLRDPADTEALVRRLVRTGIVGLTVHCRTAPMRPRERAIRAQLPLVAGICREAGVACLMNGDVASRDEWEQERFASVYVDVCTALGFTELLPQAQATDKAMGLDPDALQAAHDAKAAAKADRKAALAEAKRSTSAAVLAAGDDMAEARSAEQQPHKRARTERGLTPHSATATAAAAASSEMHPLPPLPPPASAEVATI